MSFKAAITFMSLFVSLNVMAAVSANSLYLGYPSTTKIRPNPEHCVPAIKKALSPLISKQGLSQEVLTPPKPYQGSNVITVQEKYKFMLDTYKIHMRGALYRGSDSVFEAYLIGEDTGRLNPTYVYYVYRGELENINSANCSVKNTNFYGTRIKAIWE